MFLLFGIIFSLLLQSTCCNSMFDTSFLSIYEANKHLTRSYSQLRHFDITGAMSSLKESYRIYPSYQSSNKLAWLNGMLGDVSKHDKYLILAKTHYDNLKIRYPNDVDTEDLLSKGIVAHYAGDYALAIKYYDTILADNPKHEEGLFHKGVSLQHIGDMQKAADCYYTAIEHHPLAIKSILNLAVIHHKYGSLVEALVQYERAVVIAEKFKKLAVDQYFLSSEYKMVKNNLAAAYLQSGMLLEAYNTCYNIIGSIEQTLQHRCKSSTIGDYSSIDNCGLTLKASLLTAYSILVNILRASNNWRDWETVHQYLLVETLRSSSTSMHNNSSGSLGPLLPFDALLLPVTLKDKLIIATAASSMFKATPYTGPLFSTDTTRSNLNMGRKLRLGFISCDFTNHPTAHLVEAIFNITHKLCSYDTNAVRTGRSSVFNNTELYIYNYGSPDDKSMYRTQLIQLADKFIDISHLSHNAASEQIKEDKIDILLDLQVHTLGNRLEINALQPAPLQINYLVFPGTSGAPFYQYIVGDRVVTPAEHAVYYSEKLLLLPPTYQISFYDRYVPVEVDIHASSHDEVIADMNISGGDVKSKREQSNDDTITDNNTSLLTTKWAYRQALRRLHNLPSSQHDVIFCNFNKIDKIDPESFTLWMSILHRVPNSYLWLLEPSDQTEIQQVVNSSRNTVVKANLCHNALKLGVSCDRLLFAKRTDKSSHIQRHAAADLFLDTLVYGAHSTATDALRGGLPVLTLQGDSFPSRVGASLYTALIDSIQDNHSDSNSKTSKAADISTLSTLITCTTKQFEDTAVRIIQNKANILQTLRKALACAIDNKLGMFDSERNVNVFMHSMYAIQEIEYLKTSTNTHSKYHVVVL